MHYLHVASHETNESEFQLIFSDPENTIRININVDTVKCIDSFDELRPALKSFLETFAQTEINVSDSRITEIYSGCEIDYEENIESKKQ